MSWEGSLLLMLGLLVVLFILGVPAFLSFILVVGGSILLTFGTAGYGMFVNSLYTTTTTEAFTTIPLFVFMGEILMRSGAVEVLFNSVDKLIGRVPGRQYHTTLALSAILGAPAGSGIAMAAMLGRSVMIPMVSRGYNAELTAGVIMAGAMLAPIIPPSVLAIIIGTLANVSISNLLLSGILPGLLLTAIYVITVIVKVWRDPSLAPVEQSTAFTAAEKLRALAEMIPFGIIIFVSIGLIMFDVATPSEAAGLGVLASIAEAAVRRALRFRILVQAALESALLSAVVMVMIASAVLFGQILAFDGAIRGLGEMATGVDAGKALLFFVMMAVPFVLSMFAEQIGMLPVLIPLYDPIIKAVGWDPVWFYMQFLIIMVVGSITPPFGFIIFALKAAVPDTSLGTIYRSSWLFVGATFLGIAIMYVWPAIITWVPAALK